MSLCDILKDAVKCRIAGGNAASVKIPTATQHAENGRKSADQQAHLVSGVCATYLHVQVQRTKKLQLLGFMTAQADRGHGPSTYCH